MTYYVSSGTLNLTKPKPLQTLLSLWRVAVMYQSDGTLKTEILLLDKSLNCSVSWGKTRVLASMSKPLNWRLCQYVTFAVNFTAVVASICCGCRLMFSDSARDSSFAGDDDSAVDGACQVSFIKDDWHRRCSGSRGTGSVCILQEGL